MQIMEYDTTDANSDWKIIAFTKPSTWTHRYYLQWSSAVYKNYIFIFGGNKGVIFWLDVSEDPGNVKCSAVQIIKLYVHAYSRVWDKLMPKAPYE